MTHTTSSPLDAMKRSYGNDFSGIRLKDKLLFATTLLAGLYEFQKRDLRNVYGSFNFWGKLSELALQISRFWQQDISSPSFLL